MNKHGDEKTKAPTAYYRCNLSFEYHSVVIFIAYISIFVRERPTDKLQSKCLSQKKKINKNTFLKSAFFNYRPEVGQIL